LNIRATPAAASVLAYVSVGLAVFVQAALAIWWAGVVDSRLTIVEREVTELRATAPTSAARLEEAIRKIAVIEERFVRMETDIRRIADALDRRPGAHP
jgi:hypothetical protein